MLAVCGASEDEPARLKVYENLASVNEGKAATQEVLFTNVKRIHTRNKDTRINAIECKDGVRFLFYVESCSLSTKWFKYCAVLLTIPCYTIPKMPKGDWGPTEISATAPQQLINQFSGNLHCKASMKL